MSYSKSVPDAQGVAAVSPQSAQGDSTKAKGGSSDALTDGGSFLFTLKAGSRCENFFFDGYLFLEEVFPPLFEASFVSMPGNGGP